MARFFLFVLSTCLLIAGFAGCQRGSPQVAPAEIPTLPVAHPVKRDVTDSVDYTGRTNAKDAVSIQPRVTGYLKEMPFKEGAEVKEGDLLFVIDSRPYDAQLAAAKAQVALSNAALDYAHATNERYKAIAAKNPDAVSARELDQYKALEEQAIANLNLSKANQVSAELNLEWTRVTSPIDGYISRYYLTIGNLVNQDVTQLTTLVSMDPMFVYFDMDEPTFLRISKAFNEGTVQPVKESFLVAGARTLGFLAAPLGQGPGVAAPAWVALTTTTYFPVEMGLQGEDGYPHKGSLNFVDNQVNPATGSIAVRGAFSNPKPVPGNSSASGKAQQGKQLLIPGMFVRIRLPIGQPHKALLVIDRAVTSDQGIKYVYVVDSKNEVQSRRVTLGPLQEDGMRVITDGVKLDDWVVVGGLQQVRPRMTIQPDHVTMPTLDTPATRETAPGAGKGKSTGKTKR